MKVEYSRERILQVHFTTIRNSHWMHSSVSWYWRCDCISGHWAITGSWFTFLSSDFLVDNIRQYFSLLIF